MQNRKTPTAILKKRKKWLKENRRFLELAQKKARERCRELLDSDRLYLKKKGSGKPRFLEPDDDILEKMRLASLERDPAKKAKIMGRKTASFFGYIQKEGEIVSIADENADAALALLDSFLPQEEQLKKSTVGSIRRIITEQTEQCLTASFDELISHLSNNPHYKNLTLPLLSRTARQIGNRDIPSAYPRARRMQRHFILHCGGTNTGKTHDALDAMANAASGIYLAPLRLLAVEVQDRLLQKGVSCSMLTGEESDIREDASHMSSTVEMLDLTREYEICVIDEAQMLSDRDRGWAWTNAILGVLSETVHVCMAPEALKITIAMIQSCGDSYEIIRHERNTSLEMEREPFVFPDDIKDHDAFIVFSRTKVLSVACELEKYGVKSSVIYGNLPPEAKRLEMDKFNEGITNTVVSTDAIGMGLNLPIRRIVFLETEKYNGSCMEKLTCGQVKQIAGRAGRMGLFDCGYVASVAEPDYIEKKLFEEPEDIPFAHVDLPLELRMLDGPLSFILEQWNALPDSGIYRKCISELDIRNCKWLEKNSSFDKELIWRVIKIPYNESSEDMQRIWQKFARMCDAGRFEQDAPERELYGGRRLDVLEHDYNVLELILSFCRIFVEDEDYICMITEMKHKVIDDIADVLKKSKKNFARKCRDCGKPLSFVYPYNVCDRCYQFRRRAVKKISR